MKTRITSLLGIEHPIFQAAMSWASSNSALVAAVSNAGGMGVLGAGPLRPDTRVSLAIHCYAGRMSIAIRSDEHVFSPEQQSELLQAYLDQLRTTIELKS